MKQLRVGFSRVNIDPKHGIPVRGYYVPRHSSGILDHIYANAIVFAMDEKTVECQKYNPDTGRYVAAQRNDASGCVALISVDNCGLTAAECKAYRQKIHEQTGVPFENIILHATHTHTGPTTRLDDHFNADLKKIEEYAEFLGEKLCDAVTYAVADLKAAKMGFCVGQAPERVAYIRRYKMKDGSTMTCPPINDPNIDYPIGTLDQRVNVIRFDRENADTIVLMNYGLHADCINLDQISPDWPGWMARTFEACIPNAKCVFLNGCEGDVGSTHVNPCGGDMNDTLISFDNEMKSDGMARFVGRALCGTILQVYDKVEYVDVDELRVLEKVVKVPSNKAKPEQLPLAHKYKELHDAGRDDLIPYTAMELTTVVAEAVRMCKLENGPDFFELPLTGLKIGPIGFCGIPGEPFTDIGRELKKTEGYRCILPMALTNGSEGYYPMRSAFDEGGYEARSSRYQGGVAEQIIADGQALLKELL